MRAYGSGLSHEFLINSILKYFYYNKTACGCKHKARDELVSTDDVTYKYLHDSNRNNINSDFVIKHDSVGVIKLTF